MIEARAIELADALESGKYKQARGGLRKISPDGFCCLGVAEDLIPGTTWKADADDYNVDPEYYRVYHNNSVVHGERERYALTTNAMAYYGFYNYVGGRRDEGFTHINGRNYNSLAEANDSRVSFSLIAKYIRENWAAL